MRRNEDQNILKTRILESHLQESISCGGSRASKIKLITNQCVSASPSRLLRPIARSLPLALVVKWTSGYMMRGSPVMTAAGIVVSGIAPGKPIVWIAWRPAPDD